ncbi:MAG: hypothetical protein KG029_19255 [Bacteroidetes bacterium]|nr:hypothetical protein [Bacteroidota bacterium]
MATILNIDVEEMLEKLMQNDHTGIQLLAMLKSLIEFEDKGQNSNKPDICQVAA